MSCLLSCGCDLIWWRGGYLEHMLSPPVKARAAGKWNGLDKEPCLVANEEPQGSP